MLANYARGALMLVELVHVEEFRLEEGGLSTERGRVTRKVAATVEHLRVVAER